MTLQSACSSCKDHNRLWHCRWQRALRKYKKGVEFIEHDDQFSDPEKKQSSEIKKSCNLNLAAVHLKLNDSKEACRACNKVKPGHKSCTYVSCPPTFTCLSYVSGLDCHHIPKVYHIL